MLSSDAIIPAIVSILILGTLGLSQDAMALNFEVTDQFGTVHLVDESQFEFVIPSDQSDCLQIAHWHAANGQGFVTSIEGVDIFELNDPPHCGYNPHFLPLFGTIIPTAGIIILSLPDGGGCDTFGDWNDLDFTCTMTMDSTDIDTVIIFDDDITLDCADHLLSGTGTGDGIKLVNRSFVTIKNCDLRNFDVGIHLINSNDNSLIDNSLIDEDPVVDLIDNGIFLESSNNNILTGNTVIGLRNQGFSLKFSNFNLITDNVSNGNNDGISLEESDFNTLVDNTFVDNIHRGLLMERSNSNTLSGTLNAANNSLQFIASLFVGEDFFLNAINSNVILDDSDASFSNSKLLLKGGKFTANWTLDPGLFLFDKESFFEISDDGIADFHNGEFMVFPDSSVFVDGKLKIGFKYTMTNEGTVTNIGNTILNYGVFNNTGLLNNTGVFDNRCAGTIINTGTIIGNPFIDTGIPPESGDWIITRDCTLESSASVAGDFIIDDNSVFTIPSGMTLTIEPGNKLLVKNGSGLLIKSGGTLQINS